MIPFAYKVWRYDAPDIQLTQDLYKYPFYLTIWSWYVVGTHFMLRKKNYGVLCGLALTLSITTTVLWFCVELPNSKIVWDSWISKAHSYQYHLFNTIFMLIDFICIQTHIPKKGTYYLILFISSYTIVNYTYVLYTSQPLYVSLDWINQFNQSIGLVLIAALSSMVLYATIRFLGNNVKHDFVLFFDDNQLIVH